MAILVFLVAVLASPTFSLRLLKSTLKTSSAQPTGFAQAIGVREDVEVKDVTICTRFKLKRLARDWEGFGRVFLVGEPRNMDDFVEDKKQYFLTSLDARYPYSWVSFGDGRQVNSSNSYLMKEPVTGRYEVFLPKRYSHYCISYDHESSHIRVVLDGKPLNVNFRDPMLKNVKINQNFLSNIYLGGCSQGGGIPGCAIPGGKITDFNIWSRALSTKELTEWTSCRSALKGDLINWDTSKWLLSNMYLTEDTVDLADLCIPEKKELMVLFAKAQNFSSAVRTCSRNRGKIAVMDSADVQQKQFNIVREHISVTGKIVDFWTGWTDEEVEGRFIRADTGEPLSQSNFTPHWDPGEPNGDNIENCVQVSMQKYGRWNDAQCLEKYWFFCIFNEETVYKLRGLCPNALFDRTYTGSGHMLKGYYRFYGFTDTLLYRKGGDNSYWRLNLLSDEFDNMTSAHVNVKEDYPFGTRTWTMLGYDCQDDDEYDTNSAETVLLNFNACNHTEFNCDDGNCVDINHRCDGSFDCPDRSDEAECRKVRPDKSYLKDLPAPSIRSVNEHGNKTAQVSVSAEIFSVLDINEVEGHVSVQFALALHWKDPRLTFENLREGDWENILSEEERKMIWLPQVIFYNTPGKDFSLLDDRAVVTIIKNKMSVPSLSPMQDLHNVYQFKGAENTLKIVRVYTHDILCQFDISEYPFDTQKCYLRIQARFSHAPYVTLWPRHLLFLGKKEKTKYVIKDVSMAEDQVFVNGTKGVAIRFVFGRRLFSDLMTNHFPTLLICIVSFSTNYFKKEYFEAIVTVNLTSLLVLTTLFINILNELPKTSYIKMIDLWLVGNLCVPFAETLLHTAIDNARDTTVSIVKIKVYPNSKIGQRPADNRGNHLLYKTLLRVTRIGLPAAYATFVFCYFAVGLSMRKGSEDWNDGNTDREEGKISWAGRGWQVPD